MFLLLVFLKTFAHVGNTKGKFAYEYHIPSFLQKYRFSKSVKICLICLFILILHKRILLFKIKKCFISFPYYYFISFKHFTLIVNDFSTVLLYYIFSSFISRFKSDIYCNISWIIFFKISIFLLLYSPYICIKCFNLYINIYFYLYYCTICMCVCFSPYWEIYIYCNFLPLILFEIIYFVYYISSQNFLPYS